MKAVCLLSGGMDSSTLAYYAKSKGYDLLILHANYGQRTEKKERDCARTIASLLNADEFIEIDLRYFQLFGASSLTDREIDVDQYDPSRNGIPNTYVPFRNANLLAIATSFAESCDADALFIGVQALDYSGYPDCRPAFIDAFQRVIELGTRKTRRIELIAPFLNMNKTDILALGKELKVPYEHTWSCYQKEEIACGTCGSCHFRREAFSALGMTDPIRYRES